MKTITLLSWNVNGLRAVYNKNFMDWFVETKPDILAVQETKAHEDQLPEALKNVQGYTSYFSSAERRGYSGVALYTREKPLSVQTGFGIKEYDTEGRILIANYGSFILYNIYFPNGKASKERLAYKMAFYDVFLDHADKQKKAGKSVIVCGDVNTAHQEIDLARPKENETVSGFLPEERAWIDKFISHGYIDTFRMFEKSGGHYSWWDYKTRARERNIGWRIDYFFISENLRDRIESAFILSEVTGSDHCPIGIQMRLDTT
jgi:exodeoxyribonuclease-3